MNTLLILPLTFFTAWFLLVKLPDILLYIFFPSSRKKHEDKYVKHVCDRRVDGMCVECQLNAARALLIP